MSEDPRRWPRAQTLANLALAILALALALGAAALGGPRQGIYAESRSATYEAPASGKFGA